jgi:hypothetical protein
MRIDLYATCWNEERMIPFFLRHYEPLVDRIVIFDDSSTDRSVELLMASPKVEARQLGQRESFIIRQQAELNHCWKESRGRADWVIIVDMDEHIYHRDLREHLRRCTEEGITMLEPVGYDMVSEDFPPSSSTLSESIRRGVRSFLLDKKAVFGPNAIEDVNYAPGRHASRPSGHLRFPENREVMLLHYKHLGLDYLIPRSNALRGRRTEFERARGWSLHYSRTADEIRQDFEEMLRNAEDLIF